METSDGFWLSLLFFYIVRYNVNTLQSLSHTAHIGSHVNQHSGQATHLCWNGIWLRQIVVPGRHSIQEEVGRVKHVYVGKVNRKALISMGNLYLHICILVVPGNTIGLSPVFCLVGRTKSDLAIERDSVMRF